MLHDLARDARWFITAGVLLFAATILVMIRLWWPSGVAFLVGTVVAVIGLRRWLVAYTITGQRR